MDEDVSIVGAGIVGLTTGVFLNLNGYETRIYARNVPYEDGRVPGVSTGYAAASVKPVIVDEDDMGELTRVSERFFERVAEATDAVRRQNHFEVFEGGGAEPEHADALRRYRTLDEYDGRVPTRDGIGEEGVSGYVHEIFFVEMPEYVPKLLRWYRETGGEVVRREVERDEIGGMAGRTVVNATGYDNIFEDDVLVAVRGDLVYADADGCVTDDGERFSYSYHIDGSRFVYAYPRDDSLVLGGSTLEGELVDGDWVGETPDETVRIDGVDIPRRIVETNAEILGDYGVDVEGCDKTAGYGCRPYRHGGVRTEKEGVDGKEVIHCYGHGGAGVTLSWYSADRVHGLISGKKERDYEVLDDLLDV